MIWFGRGSPPRTRSRWEFSERNWGTTAYNEFRPIWGAATSFDLPQDLDSYINAPLQIRVYSSDFARRHFDVSYQYQADNQILITARDRSVELRLRQFYMPGWRLTVDGEAYPFAADDRFGLIQFQLPEGAHLVQLDYVGTPIQHLAALVSVASVCLCLLIIRIAAPSFSSPCARAVYTHECGAADRRRHHCLRRS